MLPQAFNEADTEKHMTGLHQWRRDDLGISCDGGVGGAARA
jgi:hypothetical protein